MQRVLITGGSRGIGAACVRAFAARGDRVCFLYNNSHSEAKTLADDTGATAICADVAQPEVLSVAIDHACRTMGGLDILVNNAGVSHIGLLSDMDDETVSRVLSINLTAAITASREASRHMVREHKGYIVNIGSVWGKTGASCEAVYSASKAGLRGLTLALAKELGPSGVTVNCVEPGVIATDMNKSLDEATIAALCEETPLCRLGTPPEVAEAVTWLCSGKADFVTGQTLGIDGGFGL